MRCAPPAPNASCARPAGARTGAEDRAAGAVAARTRRRPAALRASCATCSACPATSGGDAPAAAPGRLRGPRALLWPSCAGCDGRSRVRGRDLPGRQPAAPAPSLSCRATRCSTRAGAPARSSASPRMCRAPPCRGRAQLHRAHFDPLTGLPNQVLFRDRVATAAAAARSASSASRCSTSMSTCCSAPRASVAADASERILRAQWPAGSSRSWRARLAVPARGDTFAMLLTDIEAEAQIAGATRRLVEAFAVPLRVDDKSCWPACVCRRGDLARRRPGGRHAAAAFRRRPLARLPRAIGSSCHFYTIDMHNQVIDRPNTEVALYRGLERGEFDDCTTPARGRPRQRPGQRGRALLRWNRPGCGLQMPDRFIDILEQTGLIWTPATGCCARPARRCATRRCRWRSMCRPAVPASAPGRAADAHPR